MVLPLALSLILAVAAIVDQASGQTLMHHADALYASSGKQPSAGLLYGIVYTVAIADAVLWLIVLGVARSKRRAAAALAVVTVVIAACLAFLLLVTTEYGGHIWTPLWGSLALLPAVGGILTTAQLLRSS
jgi:hypothetical protein